MKIRDIAHAVEQLAPLAYAESFDNTGLLVGDYNAEVTGVLVALDTLEQVVDEAIEKKCNLILSFHPIVFSGLKKLNGNTYVERVVIKAIQNQIAIYAIHTALDNSFEGVSAQICRVLSLKNKKILIPQKGVFKRLEISFLKEEEENLKKRLSEVGVKNVRKCNASFSVVFERHLEKKLLATLTQHKLLNDPYEISLLENPSEQIGMGMMGELETEMEAMNFLKFLKKKMQTQCIRHSKTSDKPVKKIAVLGGSGSFAIEQAKNAGADAFVSADFKYHDFYKAENQLLLADVGHYESEQFTKNLLVDHLTKKFTNFVVVLSDSITNPIHYL
jgi:dinuclear metal center YbgI/SA1388 family protein